MAVQFKFTGDDKDVQRALDAMEKKYGQLISTAKKGTDETKKMAEAAKSVFESTRTPMERHAKKMEELNALVRKGAIDYDTYARAAKRAGEELKKADGSGGGLLMNAVQTAAAYVSVASAVNLVNAGLEKTAKLQAQANAAQVSVGDAQAKFMRNLGNATPAERQDLVAQTMLIATRNKQSPAETFMLGSEALSAGAKPQAALAAVSAAQQLIPEGGAFGERSTVAGAILDMGKITKSDDAMANAGMIQALGKMSRVSSIEMTAKNLVPALMNMQSTGGTVQENMSILAGLSQVGDVTGATTGTAGSQLAVQLKEAYPEVDAPFFEGGKRKVRPGTGLSSPLERLRMLQSTKSEREKFLGTSSFEVKALAGIEGAVTGSGTPIGAAIEENLKEAPRVENAADYAREIIAGFGSTQAGVISGMNRQTASSKATLDLSDAEAAYTDEVRKRLYDITERTHNVVTGPIARTGFDMRVGLWGTDPAEAFDAVTMPDVLNLQNKVGRGAASDEESALLAELKEIARTNRESAAELRAIKANQRNKNLDLHAE